MNNTTTFKKQRSKATMTRSVASVQERSNVIPRPFIVFCVDDDSMIHKVIENVFKNNTNVELHFFETGESCLQQLHLQPDIAILDFHLSPSDNDDLIYNGLDVLDKLKELCPFTKVIMLSSQSDISTAIRCLKRGAKDYIIKDELMKSKIKKSVEKIATNIAFKQEIILLSQKIKRDKLMIKGYLLIAVAALFLISFYI